MVQPDNFLVHPPHHKENLKRTPHPIAPKERPFLRQRVCQLCFSAKAKATQETRAEKRAKDRGMWVVTLLGPTSFHC